MAGKEKSITGKLRGMMPDCKDTTMLIVKSYESRLSFYEKLKMYFHIYVACKFCNMFYKQSALLNRHIRHLLNSQRSGAGNYELSAGQKKQLQELIDKEAENL